MGILISKAYIHKENSFGVQQTLPRIFVKKKLRSAALFLMLHYYLYVYSYWRFFLKQITSPRYLFVYSLLVVFNMINFFSSCATTLSLFLSFLFIRHKTINSLFLFSFVSSDIAQPILVLVFLFFSFHTLYLFSHQFFFFFCFELIWS